MSIEGGGKKYSPEEIADFEKTRIQDPKQAHEEMNMLHADLEPTEEPTAGDYDSALRLLNQLEADVQDEPEALQKMLATFTAGLGTAMKKGPELFTAAVLGVFPYPKNIKDSIKEKIGGGVLEQLKGLGNDYEKTRAVLETAHETLERWKKEGEEFAKKQNETAE